MRNKVNCFVIKSNLDDYTIYDLIIGMNLKSVKIERINDESGNLIGVNIYGKER